MALVTGVDLILRLPAQSTNEAQQRYRDQIPPRSANTLASVPPLGHYSRMTTNDNSQDAISIADIRAAATRLKGQAVRTPLLESPFLNETAKRRVLVKAECLQRTGSFKFRGGWSAISALTEEQRKQGVLAFSSGNHAQGIAHAAQIAGVDAVIVMPNDAPELKRRNTEAFGAEVVLYDRPGGEDREAIGAVLAEKRGLHLIKPYDNPMVMSGQGTCGLEIAEQAAELGIVEADVLVCCGGGGLTSGVALALSETAPSMRVRPVEPVGYDDVIRSIESGRRETNPSPPTSICDAIITPSPGELTFPIIKRLCHPGICVSDDQALCAMREAMMRLKIIAEPGGAVALAAALYQGEQLTSDTVICIVSGGNADPQSITDSLNQRLQNS